MAHASSPSCGRLLAATLTALLVVGCASESPSADPGESTNPEPNRSEVELELEPTDDRLPQTPDVGIPTIPADGPTPAGALSTLDAAVLVAQSDLAARVDAQPTFEVVAAERMTFPDGSLGCPDADSAATQAEVDGYRILLAREGRVWIYTGADGDAPRLCPSQEPDAGRDFVPADPGS